MAELTSLQVLSPPPESPASSFYPTSPVSCFSPISRSEELSPAPFRNEPSPVPQAPSPCPSSVTGMYQPSTSPWPCKSEKADDGEDREDEEDFPDQPLPELDINCIDLGEAIMASEATGSQMPVIKNELRYRIQMKRRKSGLKDLKVEYKDVNSGNELTARDEERRRRRRESNRRAAARCRIKKRDEAAIKKQESQDAEQENARLRKEVARLQEEVSYHRTILQQHMDTCRG